MKDVISRLIQLSEQEEIISSITFTGEIINIELQKGFMKAGFKVTSEMINNVEPIVVNQVINANIDKAINYIS